MKTFYVVFDVGGNIHLVAYEAYDSLGDEIEDCLSSYLDSHEDEDLETEDIITDVMESMMHGMGNVVTYYEVLDDITKTVRVE